MLQLTQLQQQRNRNKYQNMVKIQDSEETLMDEKKTTSTTGFDWKQNKLDYWNYPRPKEHWLFKENRKFYCKQCYLALGNCFTIVVSFFLIAYLAVILVSMTLIEDEKYVSNMFIINVFIFLTFILVILRKFFLYFIIYRLSKFFSKDKMIFMLQFIVLSFLSIFIPLFVPLLSLLIWKTIQRHRKNRLKNISNIDSISEYIDYIINNPCFKDKYNINNNKYHYYQEILRFFLNSALLKHFQNYSLYREKAALIVKCKNILVKSKHLSNRSNGSNSSNSSNNSVKIGNNSSRFKKFSKFCIFGKVICWIDYFLTLLLCIVHGYMLFLTNFVIIPKTSDENNDNYQEKQIFSLSILLWFIMIIVCLLGCEYNRYFFQRIDIIVNNIEPSILRFICSLDNKYDKCNRIWFEKEFFDDESRILYFLKSTVFVNTISIDHFAIMLEEYVDIDSVPTDISQLILEYCTPELEQILQVVPIS